MSQNVRVDKKDSGQLEDTIKDRVYQGETTPLERGSGLGLSCLLYTSLILGEEPGRANKFNGSSEVGNVIDISIETSASSSSWSSSSGLLESSDTSENRTPSSSLGTGDGDGARLYLREAMNVVLEEVGEHELAVSALLCLSLPITRTGQSGGYKGTRV